MRPSFRFSLAIGTVSLLAVATLMAATQNYLAKYGASGTLVDSIVYEATGKIGIGTSDPEEKLHVTARSKFGQAMIGETDAWGFSVVEDRGTGGLALRPNGQANSGIVITESARIGIGILDPQFKVHVTERSLFGNLMIGETHESGFSMVEDRSANGLMLTATGQPDAGIVITEAARVGIGTTAPTSRLHVAGDIKVDGNIAAKYQDIAEWVVVREPESPGTVLTISVGQRDVVERSTAAYSSAVAGVVSPQPGVMLGEPGANKVLVAQSGRLKVKADATHGAIEAGDLLVTSPTAGYAMRSQPLSVNGMDFHRPGTILGKALEPLARGRGEILVLLTLQ
ncbi:MAG TPA: hypothetical protein VJM31_10205 [Vicinamibacterales bacterium]|nr:hypothetical protein [Vicinamibacterales bacterium]